MNLKEKIKESLRVAQVLSDDIAEYRSYDVDHAFEKTHRRIVQTHRRNRFAAVFSRVAAVMLIPLLTSTILLSYLFLRPTGEREEITYHTVTSAPGVISQVELPDQSKVWLNAGSTLRYPSRFSDERTVHLDGEGYFEVESDKTNPFFVSIKDGMQVKAYGTRFNVNAYADDSILETVLEQGNVDFLINNTSVELHPGELASFDRENKKVSVIKINTDEKTSWKDGVLIFRNATLEEVIKVLSRRYSVDIKLHRSSSEIYRFRAKFTNETITQILSYLKLAAPIEWSFAEVEQHADSSYPRQQIDVWLKEK